MTALTPFQTAAIFSIVVFALASSVLREVVITRLHRTGRFEEAGEPRRGFYSDLLPLRVLWLTWRFERADRWLIRAYFATSAIALIGTIAAWLVWFFSR